MWARFPIMCVDPFSPDTVHVLLPVEYWRKRVTTVVQATVLQYSTTRRETPLMGVSSPPKCPRRHSYKHTWISSRFECTDTIGTVGFRWVSSIVLQQHLTPPPVSHHVEEHEISNGLHPQLEVHVSMNHKWWYIAFSREWYEPWIPLNALHILSICWTRVE